MKSFKSFHEATKNKYELYHKTYKEATSEAHAYAEAQGYEVDKDSWHVQVTTGPRKPSEGKVVSQNIDLIEKGKPSRKRLHFQVTNLGDKRSKPFELNAYVS